MPKKSKKLQALVTMFEEQEYEIIDTEDVTVLKEMHLAFSEISDTRDSAYVRHLLGDIIMIALLAILSNADEWKQIELFGKAREPWLRRFLSLEQESPAMIRSGL